jgi:hypothetical protein
LTGDDRAQLSIAVSHASVIGDAPVEGTPTFRGANDSETTQIVQLNGAYVLMDRLQAGAGIPLERRSRDVETSGASAQGLGDIALDLAYEVLPEWSYSSWKPHGYAFLQTTLPTGPSVYDADALYQLDARGRGFFSVAFGTALMKSMGDWDFLFSAEAHRSFSRAVQTPDGAHLSLSPGWGGSAVVGAGFSPPGTPLRIGVSLSPVYEQGIAVAGSVNSESSSQLVWNASTQVGYAIQTDWSASLSYTDQTLVGPARNVSLNRTVAASLQKRWAL